MSITTRKQYVMYFKIKIGIYELIIDSLKDIKNEKIELQSD